MRIKGIENIMQEWNKDLYIVTKSDTRSINQDTGELEYSYSTPVFYKCNYQPISGFLENSQFGANAMYIQKGIFHDLSVFTEQKIKVGDLAYLDGASPTNEQQVGLNSNYTVIGVKHQNEIVTVHFQKTSSL